MPVGIFYKWEDHNHGLEHKCGTCATVLSSPRAKKTCFGHHEEVCTAYHKTLHFLGASHRCAACITSGEAHDKRHLEIAENVAAIRRLEERSSTDSPLHNNKRKGRKRDKSKPDPSDDDVHISEVNERPEVKWDGTSSTLDDENDDGKGRKQCWSGAMESTDARKAAKAVRKAAKNQVLFDYITPAELAMVTKALHPKSEQQGPAVSNGQGLADNRIIDDNIAFNAHTFKWSKLRQSICAKKSARTDDLKSKLNISQHDNEALSSIFAILGISTNLENASRERKSLDAKLRAAILGDLVAFKNDQVETMQRMAGYWRYVNRRTYNEMVQNNKLWDWATGEKLPEIREETDLDVIEEEDESGEASTLETETDGLVPENWDDPDLELSTDQTALTCAPLIKRLNTSGTVARIGTPTRQWHVDRDTELDEETLSLNSGRLSSQTMSFNVRSPLSSNGDRGGLRNEFEYHVWKGSETSYGSPTLGSPLSPMSSKPQSPHKKGFQGIKDTRVLGKAIRQASPPVKDTVRTSQPIGNLLAPATQDKAIPNPVNRFGVLNHETPAPCEEVKRPDSPPARSVVKVSARPIIKTLTIHDERDDWKTLQRPKGKKEAVKPGPAVVGALRQQAAANVHAKKFVGGKSFAAMVKKGL